MKLKFLLFVVLSLFAVPLMSQTYEVSGTVTDENDLPLPGVNVIVSSESKGTTTDFNGNYVMDLNKGIYTITFSFIGYEPVVKKVYLNSKLTSKIDLNVKMGQKSVSLDDVVLVGSRAVSRTNTSSSLPVDVLSSKDIASTGQTSFDKALQYKIPSFNTVQTPVNDATSLLDPYEIRNMGPSRTLVLINGKRKNLSALLYTQTSPGRGETGADISAIPTDAIKRVEVLRDGASAQYGSDAIAGVMNIILKDDANFGSATLRSGITSEGDGASYGVSLNNGTSISDGKGFVNYTVDFSKVNLANRPGKVSAEGEARDFGADIDDVKKFLALKPDAGNINGSPETTSAKFLINGLYHISEDLDMYFNSAYVYKKVNSFANYRTPYWKSLDDYPYLKDFFPDGPNGEYIGYLPTFNGDLKDYNGTLGFKGTKDEWIYDASFTFGGNIQTYKVTNTHNGSDIKDEDGNNIYRENSPISFSPGGTKFEHIVGNIDVSRPIADRLAIAMGVEFRSEDFTIIEGDKASYDGLGADSFSGNRPENSGTINRYNLGGYFDVMWDITDDFLINGTVRYEDYSDFGDAFVWKVSSRYKFWEDKMTIRGSVSTGFKAPTLHQIYTQKSQYSFFPGEGVKVSGLVNNISPQAKQLGIPSLNPEKSMSYTVGIGAKPIRNMSFTLDYYNINVDDRIVLSNELFTKFGKISFFSNAFSTNTSGLDVVFSYKNMSLGAGSFGFNVSGNVTLTNERTSDVPILNGEEIIDATQEALMFTSRPNTKWIVGLSYDINKFGFSLNNTYFGKTEFRQSGLDKNLKTEFTPKVVTDLGISYNANEKMTIALSVNNLFNILPEWNFVALNSTGQAILDDPAQTKVQSDLITFNQRYSQMTYDGYHFSQLGTMFSLSLNYRF